MTTIQQVLLKMEAPYAGHPYYVTGNALLHAIASAGLGYRDQRALRVSHGVFVPAPYGTFPTWHSQKGGRVMFGSTLKPVESYQDLFLFRRPWHGWILDKRPRDALNAHGLFRTRDSIQLAETSHVQQARPWFIQFYLHDDGSGVIPLDEDQLDGLHLGGSRNRGYGATSFKDTQMVDIDALDYSWVTDADSHVIELVTPYVLASEYPNTDDVDIPWWWDQSLAYRRRLEAIVEQRDRHELEVIDHGQVTRYEGDEPLATAKKGLLRVGSHSKYGFGELMVRPTD